MTYKIGDLVLTHYHEFGTAVWADNLETGLDVLEHDELAIVVKKGDYQGWVRVVTPRGVCGIVHEGNLKKS